MAFDDEVMSLMRQEFPGADLLDFGRSGASHKLSGVVAWAGFDAMDQLERQNKLWDSLKGRFTRDQLKRIGFIFTFTPFEVKALAERS